MELLSRFIGWRALLLGMFTATLVFTIGYFVSAPHAFSMPKFEMFNPAHAANALIGKGRPAKGSSGQDWKLIRTATFLCAELDGKMTVVCQGRLIPLRLYYLDGFREGAVPYLGALLKKNPFTLVTRWEVDRGAFGAFITIPSIRRDLGALLVQQSLASVGGLQPAPPASTRERYLGHLASFKNE